MTFEYIRTVKTSYTLKTKSGTYGKKICLSIPKKLTETNNFDVFFNYKTGEILIKPTKKGDSNE